MEISAFLSPTEIMVDIVSTHKGQLLLELAQKAAEALDIPKDLIATALLKREELGSTGTGGGIAIPHARISTVAKPFGILVKLRQPIDFEAIDGRPIDVVFLLLLPDAPNSEPLSALACVARTLRAPDVIRSVRHATNTTELYRAVATD
jgi:PTS system nitrogen regulatory IIA component